MPPPPAAEITRSLRSILIVDDDRDMRFYLRSCLEDVLSEDAVVDEASDGREALDQVTGGLDLLVSDVRLPGLDGLSLSEALDADPERRHIPVLLVTGEARWLAAVRRYVQERPNRALLRKPFNAADLRQALQGLLAATGPGDR